MWITQRILSAQTSKPAAEMAKVTGSAQAQGANEYRSLPFAGPWGIAYQPPNAAQAVIVSTSAGDTCIGTLAEKKRLNPGELLLYSSGGAEIYLKNNGDIVINGQVFQKEAENGS
ncbi:MAG: Lipoprotein [Oscillospiraceae bacterium]|jgi:phage gp45-like